jgi:hypothetical protein
LRENGFFWKKSLPSPGFWYNNSDHKIVIRVMISQYVSVHPVGRSQDRKGVFTLCSNGRVLH